MTKTDERLITMAGIIAILIIGFIGLIEINIRNTNSNPAITGTLAVYDVYDNLKYTFEGTFKRIDEHTYYETETGSYITFENSVLRSE